MSWGLIDLDLRGEAILTQEGRDKATGGVIYCCEREMNVWCRCGRQTTQLLDAALQQRLAIE